MKAGHRFKADVEIRLKGKPLPFVSRGGVKLNGALQAFELDVSGRVAMDVGASTGGFTDCLLQRGAERVYAIDVGYGQLHNKLQGDERVHMFERTNARHLTPDMLPLEEDESIQIISADLSFISLRLVLPAVAPFLAPGGDALLLIYLFF